MSTKTEYQELEALAGRGQWLAISTVAASGAGRVGGPFSAMDLLVALFEKLGWRCIEINGHDFSQIVPALESVKASEDSDQPTMIIAHTVKGKGVHVTEGKHEWHSKIATQEVLRIIAKELPIEEAIV
jgi:transketolase